MVSTKRYFPTCLLLLVFLHSVTYNEAAPTGKPAEKKPQSKKTTTTTADYEDDLMTTAYQNQGKTESFFASLGHFLKDLTDFSATNSPGSEKAERTRIKRSPSMTRREMERQFAFARHRARSFRMRKRDDTSTSTECPTTVATTTASDTTTGVSINATSALLPSATLVMSKKMVAREIGTHSSIPVMNLEHPETTTSEGFFDKIADFFKGKTTPAHRVRRRHRYPVGSHRHFVRSYRRRMAKRQEVVTVHPVDINNDVITSLESAVENAFGSMEKAMEKDFKGKNNITPSS